jgi:hypothetical protein
MRSVQHPRHCKAGRYLGTQHISPPASPTTQAERTSRKAGLADRLVNGLSGENKRWSETIRRMEGQEGMLVGDVLLAAAFVSYAGPFNMAFRQQLVTERWLPDIIERGIPLSTGVRQLRAGGQRGMESTCFPGVNASLAHPPPGLPQASARWTC